MTIWLDFWILFRMEGWDGSVVPLPAYSYLSHYGKANDKQLGLEIFEVDK